MRIQSPNILQSLLVAILASNCLIPVQAQEPVSRNALSISAGPSIPYAEFANKTFTNRAGFAKAGANLNLDIIRYGRDGSFDIYRAVGEANRRIETSDSLQVTKMEVLSGSSDDKCPYIINNTMVFTSNRDGGYGGYDLWYSVFEDGAWSAPVNFGPAINTPYDEYRPIIIPTQPELFLNDMLIFSSNRPGGKGGFDLYYTGLNKRGENL